MKGGENGDYIDGLKNTLSGYLKDNSQNKFFFNDRHLFSKQFVFLNLLEKDDWNG